MSTTPIYALIEQLLREYGLESLVGTVRTWMEDGLSEDEITIRLEETPQFEARFPAIKARREAGMSPISPAEYVQYENTARQMMRASGLPAGFYDSNTDFTELIAGDVSLVELQGRVEEGYRRVAGMDSAVRDAFFEYFGADSDSALAAYYLDPDKALPILERQTVQAQIGGSGRRLGYSISSQMTELLARRGATSEQAQSAIEELHQGRAVFTEAVSEGEDLSLEEEGLEATFGLDANSVDAIEKRKRQRVAHFSGSGGAAAGEEGFTGAGSQKTR